MNHGGAERRIRIRIDGDDDASDLRALHRWLSLEEWFTEAEAARELKVVFREGDGTEQEARRGGPPMSSGVVELVLVIAGAALSPVFDDLYNRARVAVRAWADNSSSEQHRVEAAIDADDPPVAAGDGDGGGAEDRADGGGDGRTR
jgi:hypothetical protein